MAFFYVFFSIVFIFFAPIFLGATLYFDLKRGIVIAKIKLFGFNIFNVYLKEKDGKIFMQKGKNPEKKLGTTGNGGGFPFFKAVKIRKVKMVAKIGLNDAASTALLTATLNNIQNKNIKVTCMPDYENGTTLFAEIKGFTAPIIGALYGFREIKVNV